MKNSCTHISKRRNALLTKYSLLVKRVVFPISSRDICTKASLVSCKECGGSRLNTMMCCCFDCATFACLPHIREHMTEKLHFLAVSTNFGELFCLKCNDFIYDKRIEKIRRDCQNSARRRLGLSLKYDWNPGKAETKIFRKNSFKMLCMNQNSTRGLRGLVNLGNSCFMNCIIQTLMHIPMLRDYFLSDQHNCLCQDSQSSNKLNHCLMCELAHIFQEFYGGEIVPYVPNRMLHLVWTHAEHLAGHEQHDAHEFLISALNVLHKHSESSSMKVNPHECKCIIDRLFTGQLQSDLTCSRCGRVSTTVDPYWDISLELNGCSAKQKKQSSLISVLEELSDKSSFNSSEFLNTRNNDVSAKSLEECLRNFVKPENLDANSKIKCDNCGTYEESVKQLTLKKLPIVACFHLKRFEHTLSARRQKIRDPIKYPEFIDLTPYTTAFRDSYQQQKYSIRKQNNFIQNNTNQILNTKNGSFRHLAQLANKYTLIAVVNHNGTTESGHYSCYIRHHREHWYKCNDHIISRERVDQVLESEGYLLFYCKMFIDYD